MEDKTVAILTSGGDCPGMNACICAIAKSILNRNAKVLGVYRGYEGLIDKDFREIAYEDISDISHIGGTFLLTARSVKIKTKTGIKLAFNILKQKKVDVLVAIGGDGTFRAARALRKVGMPIICIPGTIDNDINCSEYSIGFDTAANTAVNMIDKLRDTSTSHGRCAIVEVMGKNSGNLASYIGTAAEATATLVPEVSFNFEKDVVEPVRERSSKNLKHSLVVVSENFLDINDIAKKISENAKVDVRVMVLGHVQRGGNPSAKDRVVANKMGCMAAYLIENKKFNKVIVMKNGKITYLDMQGQAE
ncbi:MAG: ATP-dependent 6-phosphofructokinase [Oscillospiraceae bacterium]|nr:ATP-dependent 6-phosphofructokinase [Oscillospiraceae bacterium]